LVPLLCLKQDALIGKAEDEIVLEGGRLFIDAKRQEPADADPKGKPEESEDEEGHGRNLSEYQQEEGNEGEYVDNDDEGADLRATDKVSAKAIHYFLFIVAELYRHCGKSNEKPLAAQRVDPKLNLP
jgi:hypothetical protein